LAGMLVSSIEWRHLGERWRCSLLCLDEDYRRISLEPGSEFAFRVLDGRFCIGYTGLSSKGGGHLDAWREQRPCPNGAEVERRVRCRDCSSMDVMRACLRCNGTLCSAPPDVRRACEASTAHVYLASFGDGRVKAGVSRGRRVLKRWVEQGADVALRVLVGDGMEVRRFESKIQRDLGALNHVSSSLKIDPVRRKADVDAAVALLEEFKERVHDHFPEENHYNEEPQVILPLYGLPDIDKRPLQLRVREGLEASGAVLGAKGPVLFMEMNGLPYSLRLNRLRGRRIETQGIAPTSSQAGLDRFFGNTAGC
jgi:hypothetical protein